MNTNMNMGTNVNVNTDVVKLVEKLREESKKFMGESELHMDKSEPRKGGWELHNLLILSANTIEELLTANTIKELLSNHNSDEWISAKYKLPQDGQNVLIWYQYYPYGDEAFNLHDAYDV